jgi:hypothetical protein
MSLSPSQRRKAQEAQHLRNLNIAGYAAQEARKELEALERAGAAADDPKVQRTRERYEMAQKQFEWVRDNPPWDRG